MGETILLNKRPYINHIRFVPLSPRTVSSATHTAPTTAPVRKQYNSQPTSPRTLGILLPGGCYSASWDLRQIPASGKSHSRRISSARSGSALYSECSEFDRRTPSSVGTSSDSKTRPGRLPHAPWPRRRTPASGRSGCGRRRDPTESTQLRRSSADRVSRLCFLGCLYPVLCRSF